MHETVAVSDFSESQEHPYDSGRVDYQINTLIAQGHRDSTFITVREIPQEEALFLLLVAGPVRLHVPDN